MVTEKQRKARALFAKRAKSGVFQNTAVFSAAKIRGSGVSIRQFISNLRRKGYSARERPDGSVKVNLKR
jgi:hypothetical protein